MTPEHLSPQPVSTAARAAREGPGTVAGRFADRFLLEPLRIATIGLWILGVLVFLRADAVFASGLPDTGQTTSHNPGDDASYATGCDPSYTDNGNGTVTDNCTGLTWQQGTSSTTLSWSAAIDYCEELALADRVDWRLPNVRELESIVDYGRNSPSLHPTFVGPAYNYWSSTSVADAQSGAWIVTFEVGGTGTEGKDRAPLYARCVRGTSSVLPETGAADASQPGDDATYSTGCQPTYTDNGNGTVSDRCTGLLWEQLGTSNVTWSSAISYCEALTLAGYTDWRLPSIRELGSVIDYGTTDPALPAELSASPSLAWTSTLSPADLSFGVALHVEDRGTASVGLRSLPLSARCVREDTCRATEPGGEATCTAPIDNSCDQLTQLTGGGTCAGGCADVQISADGTVIVFSSVKDLLGDGLGSQLRRVFRIGADGSDLRQLPGPTPGMCGGFGQSYESGYPTLSANGNVIAYSVCGQTYGFVAISTADGTTLEVPFGPATRSPSVSADGSLLTYIVGGTTVGSTAKIALADPTGLLVNRIVHEQPLGRGIGLVTISGDGERILFRLGSPDETRIITTDGSVDTQVVVGNTEALSATSVDQAGRRVVFQSLADLTGENPDASFDVFLWEDGESIRQITHFPAGNHAVEPAISGNGNTVAFLASVPSTSQSQVIRLDLATRQLTQVTPPGTTSGRPRVSSDGSSIVFISRADLTGQNPSNEPELFLATCGTADADGDGVLDTDDECPDTPASEPVDPSGCGCSQLACDDGETCNGVESCNPGQGCQLGTPPAEICDNARDDDCDGQGDLFDSECCSFDSRAARAFWKRDEDRDGLPNRWEICGFDSDGDGTIDVDLPVMGSDALTPDIFVETDWLEVSDHNHRLSDEALLLITEMFKGAPRTHFASGVNLHIDRGEYGGGNAIRRDDGDEVIGAAILTTYVWNEFCALKAIHFDKSRAPIFHYVILGHSFPAGFDASGISVVGHNDIIVALGTRAEPPRPLATILAHEIGHNLGLYHGGSDHKNEPSLLGREYDYKPNYLLSLAK